MSCFLALLALLAAGATALVDLAVGGDAKFVFGAGFFAEGDLGGTLSTTAVFSGAFCFVDALGIGAEAGAVALAVVFNGFFAGDTVLAPVDDAF